MLPEDPQSTPGAAPEGPEGAPQAQRRVRLHLPELRPVVTYTILALAILVYLVQVLTDYGIVQIGNWTCPYYYSLDIPACYGLKVNELILRGQWWRLVTPILLHGSILHIGFNMYALYILGPDIERHYGHKSFLALFITSGFSGFVLSFLLTESASLGASTAIFGLLAAQGVFVYRNRQIFGARARLVLRSIINIALINFLIGLSPGIDNWGHLGGLIGGVVFSWLASPQYKVEGAPPDLHLADQNRPNRWIVASFAVLLLFGAAAAGSIWGFQAR
jgi:rhomboid protease GluP